MGPVNDDYVPPPRVAFGSRDTQVLDLTTASELLTLFCKRQPVLFGSYLAEVLTGVPPRKIRA
jgi:hypothetical protein